jgi:hypothetical protein
MVRTSSSVTLPVTSQPSTLPELSSSLLIKVASFWLTHGTTSFEGRFTQIGGAWQKHDTVVCPELSSSLLYIFDSCSDLW